MIILVVGLLYGLILLSLASLLLSVVAMRTLAWNYFGLVVVRIGEVVECLLNRRNESVRRVQDGHVGLTMRNYRIELLVRKLVCLLVYE
jgi:ABC-type branched-subunit amino acid transport system permease subunit